LPRFPGVGITEGNVGREIEYEWRYLGDQEVTLAEVGTVVQALDATADITAYGAAARANGEVFRLDSNLTRLNVRESFSLGLGGGLGVIVQGAAVTAALAIAIPAVVSGRLGPVWLAVVALLPLALFDVLAGLPASALAYQRLRGSATRIVEVETAPLRVTEPAHPVPVPHEFFDLELVDVSASWVEAVDGQEAVLALDSIDLRVGRGERVAVVGPSGSGKSTLASVLMGFLPYSGSVRLSGVELRDAEGDAVRQVVGMLTQQAHIFDTSIADNVRLGDPTATDEEVMAALTQAQLDEWVGRLPLGLDTVVGSFGVGISGGERQRIALARLLLARRSLVILDEPTEHLDGATAEALTTTMTAALRDDTILLITHRLTGLESFDRIVEIQGGRVIAQGTHAELLETGGWYADQWQAESELHDMAALLPTLPVGIAVPGPIR